MSGRIQYVGTTTSYFTNGQQYVIVAIAPAGGTGPGAYVAVVDDTGDLHSVDTTSANFSITELFASSKVV